MKGENIATRLRHFGAAVIRLCRNADDVSAKHVAKQLVRASTGGGANYEEARGAESRADFIHKLGIANKEVREALYWLRLAQDAALFVGDDLEALIREADELVRRRRAINARANSEQRTENRERERPVTIFRIRS